MATEKNKKTTTAKTTTAPAAAAKAAVTAAKAEPEVKKVETKAAEAKSASAAKKPAAKKTTAKKPVAKKTAAKKKVEATQKVVIQVFDKEIVTEDIVKQIQDTYVAEGHYLSSIKSLEVYVKPEENKAYYVINGKPEDKSIDL